MGFVYRKQVEIKLHSCYGSQERVCKDILWGFINYFHSTCVSTNKHIQNIIAKAHESNGVASIQDPMAAGACKTRRGCNGLEVSVQNIHLGSPKRGAIHSVANQNWDGCLWTTILRLDAQLGTKTNLVSEPL